MNQQRRRSKPTVGAVAGAWTGAFIRKARRPRQRTLAAALLSIVMLVVPAVSAVAGNFATGPLVQVSGTSLFAGCTADGAADQSGTLSPDSEVEPWIDVNPTNLNNIVGIWQQDRWSNGGARGLVAGVSFDGGSSWEQVVIPKISRCSGGNPANNGDYQRATDPWVTFSPNGHLHQLALSFNDITGPSDPPEAFDHALLASKSEDGGRTWTDPVVVIRDLDANVFNDKQSITADPHDSDFVYAVWDRLIFPPSERANVVAGFTTAAFRGPAWFTRTTDGGQTWEPARQIFDPGQQSQTIANQIAVLPDGDLVNLFNLIKITRGALPTGALFNVALIRSEDRGVTWGPQAQSGKITPIVVDKLRTIGITDPETGDPVRTGDIIPDIAVDPNSGALYVAWQDARPNGLEADAVVVSKSVDGGFTWSPMVKVNKTPANIASGNQQAFTPSVDVADDGTVSVTYYDFRNNTPAADLLTDYFVVHCHPTAPSECTNAEDWGNEIRLTDVSFDMRQAPFARGFFTGDYEGLANAGNDFTPFFSQPHAGDPSSTFFRRVGP
jgi:hypothetical protein